MKKIMKMVVVALCTLCATTTFAQSAADKLLGVYHAVEEGKESKVKFTKLADGTFQGQIIWLMNPNNEDGSRKYDVKNPNPELRKVPSDQVVIIYGLKYNAEDNCWDGGKVYKPNNGKTYRCEISFKDAKTLRVKGSLGPISLSRYWNKVE
ncbi:MAG: DUF2147 domain-containing protein [Rikenellaceae bacterium]|nr:DUF2147 domain-containing protein [Rikenellaceae bacterium]